MSMLGYPLGIAGGQSAAPRAIVGPDGQAGITHTSVQAAIDAVAADGGGVVYIRRGTYTEDISLTSDTVHLRGAGAYNGATLVGAHTIDVGDAPGDASTSHQVMVEGLLFAVGVAEGPVLTIEGNPARVWLRDCRIWGNATAADALVVDVTGGLVAVEGCHIWHSAGGTGTPVHVTAGTLRIDGGVAIDHGAGGYAIDNAGGVVWGTSPDLRVTGRIRNGSPAVPFAIYLPGVTVTSPDTPTFDCEGAGPVVLGLLAVSAPTGGQPVASGAGGFIWSPDTATLSNALNPLAQGHLDPSATLNAGAGPVALRTRGYQLTRQVPAGGGAGQVLTADGGGGFAWAAAGGGDLLAANNLGDVDNAATSRVNLGLGDLAVLNRAALREVTAGGAANQALLAVGDGTYAWGDIVVGGVTWASYAPAPTDQLDAVHWFRTEQGLAADPSETMTAGFAAGRPLFGFTGDSLSHVSLGTGLGTPSSYSLVVAYRTSVTDPTDRIMGAQNAGGSSAQSWGTLLLISGRLRSGFGDGANSSSTTTDAVVIASDTWYVITITYADGDDEVLLYVDGVAVATSPTSTAATSTGGPNQPFSLGRLGGFVSDSGEGYSPGVLFYDRVLTPAEVLSLNGQIRARYAI